MGKIVQLHARRAHAAGGGQVDAFNCSSGRGSAVWVAAAALAAGTEALRLDCVECGTPTPDRISGSDHRGRLRTISGPSVVFRSSGGVLRLGGFQLNTNSFLMILRVVANTRFTK